MSNDIIRLTIPSKGDYLSSLRLVTSSLANKIGFDIENVEDIVMCSSEASNIAIKQQKNENIEVEYHLNDKSIKIYIDQIDNDLIEDDFEMKMSKMIIESLSDGVEFEGGRISILKNLE